eukprot:5793233-Amphidinium_carterae.1
MSEPNILAWVCTSGSECMMRGFPEAVLLFRVLRISSDRGVLLARWRSRSEGHHQRSAPAKTTQDPLGEVFVLKPLRHWRHHGLTAQTAVLATAITVFFHFSLSALAHPSPLEFPKLTRDALWRP